MGITRANKDGDSDAGDDSEAGGDDDDEEVAGDDAGRDEVEALAVVCVGSEDMVRDLARDSEGDVTSEAVGDEFERGPSSLR